MSKADEVDSSLSERPEHQRPRRLADWINPTGARKAHSLIDKVYKRKNLLIAWERVKANRGAGGVDGESIEAFGGRLEERLGQLNRWIVQRIWSHRYRRWRCCGWRTLPERKLYGEYGLVNLIALIPSLAASRRASS